ncbi:MATE family efflux transporter [Alteromonas gilva]|uniref:MATE family efflux transporter n=1 Tax=Alteromonas gilva TaxID=2987522 RepID=A0ABT5KXE9_9ALTE|nr:MATE family efflux transporter [Alteromonas gilva]MDC8829307.1 MATE family efflux transporter [Alteromonas gilva]
MILANITTPLLGLVDTAVMGHMDSSAQLAGASIGALMLTQIYWVCGFLRMSATGMSAQARGEQHSAAIAKSFYQTSAIALLLGLIILLCQSGILTAGLWLASPATDVALFSREYFNTRVWGAPAALLNMALIGWLVGQQKTTAVLVVQVIGNLLNAGLDILLVWWLDWGVSGVAFASVVAEYSMMLMALVVALRQIDWHSPQLEWFDKTARKFLMKLNGDMLVRNLALQLCLAFLTIQGARYGQTATAVNAILMQFFVLIALGLDGIAYAVEATVGEAAGAKSRRGVLIQTRRGLGWSAVFAVIYSVVFYCFGEAIVNLLTDIRPLQVAAYEYLPMMTALPLVAHWCFLYDGVFVGLTQGRAMRNTMIVSAALVFFPVWYVTQAQGNPALWWALLAFLLARGVTLGGVLYWQQGRGKLISSAD